MSKTYNLVGGGNVERAVLAIQATNGFPTSVTATNGTKTVNLTLNGELPSGYTQLEYLESTGTQYINTGIVPTANTRIVSAESLQQYVGQSGWGSSGSQEAYQWTGSTEEGFNSRVSSNYSMQQTGISVDSERHIFDLTGTGNLLFDGVQYGNGTCGNTATSGQTIYLFALHAEWMSNTGSVTGFQYKRQYYCAIYSGNTLARNFIPARRNSDSALGMYDTVNDTFYTNAGTGTFVAGPTLWTGNVTTGTWTVTATDGTNSGSISITVDDVKVYSRIVGMSELGGDYTKLEYLESSNAQYIDTGYYPKTTTSMKFRGWTYSGFGVGYISSTGGSRFCIFKSTNYNVGFGTEWNNVIGTWDADAGVVHDFYVSIPNRQAKFDNGSYVSLSGTFTVQTTYPFLIFGMHENGSILKSKIRTYVLELYENNVMIRKFTPARRNSDSVVGMYDIVNNVFYTNDGTGTFIAGPAV